MTRVLVGLAVLFAFTRPTQADEIGRIRTHLTRALDHVRARDVSALSPHQQQLRARSVVVLERYIARGLFPRRTSDAFAGLRPRFIDDRGVHCADGHLIAESGETALAQAINRDYEYAYVRDMRSSALLAWAVEHGFTVDELAMIQPSYEGPPTGEGIRQEIEREKPDFILACTGSAAPPTKIALHVKGTDRGVVTATAKADTDFARCFANRASGLERGGGAYSPSPTAFTADFAIELPSPQQLLEQWLAERTGYGPDCTPRPGAVPKQATIDFETAAEGVAIHVATTPSNAEVNTCIADYLRPKLQRFHHHIKLRKQIALAPRVHSRAVEDLLRAYAPTYATDCYTSEAPANVRVVATAKRDAKQLAIKLEGANESFSTCVADKLQQTIRTKLSVPRERDGKVEQYFRIDTDVTAGLAFTVETPAKRDARIEKARKAAETQRRKLEEELERHKYDF